MKLKPKVDVMSFLTATKSCAGEVEFHTEEGDCLNLKSELSKYLFAAISGQDELMNSGYVICRYEPDYALLGEYLQAEDRG